MYIFIIDSWNLTTENLAGAGIDDVGWGIVIGWVYRWGVNVSVNGYW